MLGHLVLLPYTREAFDHPLSSFLVKTFHVSRLASLHRRLDEYLEESQVKVLVDLPRRSSVRFEWRYEAADCYYPAVGK